jgi:pimeloyl-ACP methyl ester carboxylesterase
VRPRRRWLLLAALLGALLCVARAPGEWGGLDASGVRVWTIHYRTHDGFRSAAYVILPGWYGPHDNPPLPLVISPHGRGLSGRANVQRWGDLPSDDEFAVVNPDGHGRVLRLYSWGYSGQIDDLARMPEIVRHALPWLRIERSRIYAFGASMGGQETLLLAARHPTLLAGAAAFDPVTDLARRYYEFSGVPCNAGCVRRWGAPIGTGLQTLAQEEIGGTPATARNAYAARSPITYARRLADSGVPLELWWSRKDRIVMDQGHQSASLVRALLRLNPSARVHAVAGSWRHSYDMREYALLMPALRRFDLLPK